MLAIRTVMSCLWNDKHAFHRLAGEFGERGKQKPETPSTISILPILFGSKTFPLGSRMYCFSDIKKRNKKIRSLHPALLR